MEARESKFVFKALTVSKKEWAYGCYLFNDVTAEHYIATLMTDSEDIHLEIIDPATLCMSTGLYDEEGSLVFENDILQGEALKENGSAVNYKKLVSFRDGTFYVSPDKYICNNIRNILSPTQKEAKTKAKCRVIGNIYDPDYHESRKGAVI